jgi:hypothetical protein
MHHSNCSVGLGISNDHAMQWIAPKIVANNIATKIAQLHSSSGSFPE